MDGKELPQPQIEQKIPSPETSPNKLGLRFFEAQRSKGGSKEKNSPDNEDTVRVSTKDSLVIVCDGMGGLRNAKAASESAASEIEKRLKWIPDNDPQYFQKMERTLIEASQEVRARLPQGGTTATVAKIVEINGRRKLRIASIGDSRAYIVNGQTGWVSQITVDDSLVNREEKDEQRRTMSNYKLDRVKTEQDYAQLTPQEKSWFDRRNQITQYLGDPNPVKPHLYEIDLGDDDLVVVVTDGVSDNLGAEIEKPLRNYRVPVSRKAQLLVEGSYNYSEAEGRPGYKRAKTDDCSAVVIDVGEKLPDEKFNLQALLDLAGQSAQPEAFQRLTPILVGAANDSQLGYGDSRVIAELISKFYRAREKLGFRDNIRQDRPEDQARRKALEVIIKKANLGARIERFYKIGQSQPDFFETIPGTTESKAYYFVTGALPEVYPDHDPQTQRAIQKYNRPENKRQLAESLKGLQNMSGGGETENYWTEINSKAMHLKLGHAKGDVGRIYLNIKPEMQIQVFAQLARFLNNNPQVEFGAKMITPGHMDINGLRRGDSTVLYFGAKDQQRILDIVRSLYSRFGPNAFEQVSPMFAATLKDESGALMRGISFGQDPREIKASFNKIRLGALESLKAVYGTPEFEYQFQRVLHRVKVDYSNPAFNWPPEKGKQLFSIITSNSN